MNIKRPNFRKSWPGSVRASGDRNVYLVRSASRIDLEHRVDLDLLQCNCESADVGKARRDAIANGGCPTYFGMCDHLGLALVAHALVKLEEENVEVKAIAKQDSK